jgi:hypothetical protein
MPAVLRLVPGDGSAAYPGLLSLAGAAGTATGLSLRSPRTARNLFLVAGHPFRAGFAGALSLPAGKHLRHPGRPVALPPYSACLPFRRRNTPRPGPATGTALRREHDMDAICSQCHGPAPDGPVFAEAGLLCWPCADERIDALRLLFDPAGDLDVTAA